MITKTHPILENFNFGKFIYTKQNFLNLTYFKHTLLNFLLALNHNNNLKKLKKENIILKKYSYYFKTQVKN